MAGDTERLTRHDLEAKIVKRCWENEEFRKEFTADPVGTASKYLELPPTKLPKIVIHDEEPGSWHIVLPPKPVGASEISEVELERIAGGGTPASAISAVTVLSTILVSYVSYTVSKDEGGW